MMSKIVMIRSLPPLIILVAAILSREPLVHGDRIDPLAHLTSPHRGQPGLPRTLLVSGVNAYLVATSGFLRPGQGGLARTSLHDPGLPVVVTGRVRRPCQ